MTDFTKRQLELIQEHRDINVDWHEDWNQNVIEHFTSYMAEKHGIEVGGCFFSGFWSQGDGASFEGSVVNFHKFIDTHNCPVTGQPLKDRYPFIKKLIKESEEDYKGSFGFTPMGVSRTRSRYCHENTMVVDDWSPEYFVHLPRYDVSMEDEFRRSVVKELDRRLINEYAEFEEDVLAACRAHARDLYDLLKEEYERLTSDEAVWETIVASELDKQEGVA
jgi:hypothetical protein